MPNSKQLLVVLGLAAALPGCVVPPPQNSQSSSGVRGQQGAQPEAQVMADVLKNVDALSQEVRDLRDQSERSTHEMEGLQQRQRDLYLDVDKRLQALEGGRPSTSSGLISRPVLPPLPSSAGSTPAVPPTLGSTPVPAQSSVEPPRVTGPSTPPPPLLTKPAIQAGPEAAFDGGELETYNHAFNLLKDGNYPSAVSAFQQFMGKYPQSAYSGNAQYWLAEANYVSKDYPAASTEFKKVVDQYPQSSKVRDAQLKLAFSYYELGKWQEARVLLEEVRTRYPGSTVARLADQRLTRMAQEGR